MKVHARCADEGGRARSCSWQFFCAGVHAKLFWREIYCAKPRPDTRSQSGFRYHRGLGRKSPRIMWEYNLETAFAIRPLTQPRSCEMGSSSFVAMSPLKLMSTARESFPNMPSTEMKNREIFFRCLWQCLPCLSLFYSSQ